MNITRPWVRRAGFAAFLFFLVKGLVWLGVAAVLFEGALR